MSIFHPIARRAPRRCLPPVLLVASAVSASAAAPTPSEGPAIYVDDSPAAAQLFEAARKRLEKGDLQPAANRVQEALDKHRRKLVERNGRYVEVSAAAAAFLGKHPELLETYRELHQPVAARALEKAGTDRAKLATVVRRYPMTEAGLRAALRHAGLALETWDPTMAGIVLEGVRSHPDLEKHRVRWQWLRAAAALYAGERSTYREARAALKERGATEKLARLQAWEESVTRPPSADAVNPLGRVPKASVPSEPKRIWSVDYKPALPKQWLAGRGRSSFQRTLTDRMMLTGLPVVQNRRVYMSNGRSVFSVKLRTGQGRWQYEDTDAEAVRGRIQPGRSGFHGGLAPLSGVAPAGDRVVSVLGFKGMLPVRFRSDGPPSQLVCLRSEDGKHLWDLHADDVDPDFDSAFWHGQPIVSGGRVFVQLRRRQRTQFHDAYVVAVDLGSGKILWVRHIASTAVSERSVVPPLGQMRMDGGWLYVQSHLGAVARVRGADGSVDWLTTFPGGKREMPKIRSLAWQESPPLLVDAGLLILDKWTGTVRLLDPSTGEPQKQFPASRWANPRYLLGAHGDVFSLGASVVRRDGKTLETKWTKQRDGKGQGRAVVSGKRLYIPEKGRVSVVDVESGDSVTTLEVATPANILPAQGQLLVAEKNALSAYSAWSVVSGKLRARMKETPKAPAPRVALSWLAFKLGHHDALVETVKRAVDLVEEKEESPAKRRLFQQLMTMVGASDRAHAALREALFEQLGRLVNKPSRQVAYLFELARFRVEQGDPKRAVEAYQRVLASKALRRKLYRHEAGSRRAGLEAKRRLAALIEKHGREIYQKQDAYASQRLRILKKKRDAKGLAALARAYPVAEAALSARRLAAKWKAAAGDVDAADRLLQEAIDQAASPDKLAELYGQRVQLLARKGHPGRARRVLRKLIDRHSDLRPLRNGQAVDPRDWLADLPAAERNKAVDWPRVAPSFSPSADRLSGELLRPKFQSARATPVDRFLLRTASGLQMRMGEDLSVAWTRSVDAERVELLRIDRFRAWIWYPKQDRLAEIDAETGKLRWSNEQIDGLSGLGSDEGGGHGGRERVRLPLRRMVQRARQTREEESEEKSGRMLAFGRGAIAVANSGKVKVLDAKGGEVRWEVDTGMQLRVLAMGNGLVAVGGKSPDDSRIIYLYDAETGQEVHPIVHPAKETLVWAELTGDGTLFYLTASRMVAFDVPSRRSRWTAEPGADLTGGEVTVGREHLVVQTEQGDLIWVRARDGNLAHRLPFRFEGALRVRSLDGRWLVIGSERCLVTRASGKIVWKDGIAGPKRFVAAAVSKELVWLLSRRRDRKAVRLFGLDRRHGMIRFDYQLTDGVSVDKVTLLPDALLVSGEDGTAVLKSKGAR